MQWGFYPLQSAKEVFWLTDLNDCLNQEINGVKAGDMFVL